MAWRRGLARWKLLILADSKAAIAAVKKSTENGRSQVTTAATAGERNRGTGGGGQVRVGQGSHGHPRTEMRVLMC